MSNDCTYVNQLTKNKNLDGTDDNSSDIIYQKITDYQLTIKADGKLVFFLCTFFLIKSNQIGFDDLVVVCPKRTCNKLHALSPIKNDTRYWIMVSVVTKKLSHTITIRSPLMV